MTRINSAIDPKNLTDEHLMAEHRELERIPNAVIRQALSSGLEPNKVEKFTLGKGHVLFFYDKLAFLYRRYVDIHKECHLRGIRVLNFSDSFMDAKNLAPSCWNDYTPTFEEHGILVEHIAQRIMGSPKSCFRYYGRVLSKFEAINLLINSKYE